MGVSQPRRALLQTAPVLPQTPFSLTEHAPGLYLHRVDLPTYLPLCHHPDTLAFFLNMTQQLAGQGLRVVHLWDDVVRQKPTIVASRLAALRGESIRVPGRLTQVRRLDRATAMDFLDENHLQAALPGKVRYGLFLPERYYRVLPPTYLAPLPPHDLLVAVATFAQPRTQHRPTGPHRSAELLRMASRLGLTVVGGLDKLLTTYLTNHPANDLMTYADRDWGDGNSYRKVGFEVTGQTPPQPFWLDLASNSRYTAIPPGAVTSQTGFIPVYNTGSFKFVRPHPWHRP